MCFQILVKLFWCFQKPKQNCLVTLFQSESRFGTNRERARADRTKCVSLYKTKHSSAEVLISVTVRGRSQGAPPFARRNKYFCVCPTPRWSPKRAPLVLRKSIWHKQKTCTSGAQKNPFGTNRNVPNGTNPPI